MKTQTRPTIEIVPAVPEQGTFVSCRMPDKRQVGRRTNEMYVHVRGAFTFAVHVRIRNAWESSMFPIPSALRSHRKTAVPKARP